jgi:CRISPR/Cas system CSM-associated protein Csm3 (group 7 of RAMP superfamily)
LITRAFQTRRDELRARGTSGEEEEEQAVQALVEYECFAPGTRFYHEIVLETDNVEEKLDLSTLYRAIELWQQLPYIGGKSSVGFGKLRIEYEWVPGVDSRAYSEFIERNKSEIVKALDELAEVV